MGKVHIILIVIPFLVMHVSAFNAISQDDCTVLMANISGTYSGKCKKGLAHGKGRAAGVDIYVGKFKRGLPNGYGECFYSDGRIYKGFWKNGMKHGNGMLIFPCVNCSGDSVVTGIWFHDEFLRSKKPASYSVIQKRNLDRYTFFKESDGNSIRFQFFRGGSMNTSIRDLNIYGSSGFLDYDGGFVIFKDILFPFRCKITYFTLNKTGLVEYFVTFEFEIHAQGRWELKLFN